MGTSSYGSRDDDRAIDILAYRTGVSAMAARGTRTDGRLPDVAATPSPRAARVTLAAVRRGVNRCRGCAGQRAQRNEIAGASPYGVPCTASREIELLGSANVDRWRVGLNLEKNVPVYLVDDDDAVRAALTLLLDTVGLDVTAFADPLDFLQQLDGLSPGTLVVDIRMPGLSGLRLQERLEQAGCRWPVIVISGHGDIEACRRAFRQGAVDYLRKPVDEQELIDAVQKAEALLVEAAAREAATAETAALFARLSPRERQVVDLVARGLTSREIGELLSLSPRTVETHRAAAGAKLGTCSVAEIAQLVIDAPAA